MRTPYVLLQFIAKALLNAVAGGVGGQVFEFAFEVLPAVASDVQEWWGAGRDEADRRAELERLARTPPAELSTTVSRVVEEVAGDRPLAVRRALTAYLTQVPATVRRTLRRPADPAGITAPPSLSLQRAEDLLPFLPSRVPHFHAGARPFANTAHELVELLGAGAFGEVWKARTGDPRRPFVALKFCVDPSARDLWRHEAALLRRVMRHGRHPGIVGLLATHLENDPPCLEYEYAEGGDLASLIQEWHRPPRRTARRLLEDSLSLLHDLTDAVAFAHRLDPPIVHRDLKPANVLLQPLGDGRLRPRVADFGIAAVAAGQAISRSKRGGSSLLATALRGAHTPLYASPQQARGAPPDPRDDVHALGVVWHQMLTGDLTAGRPGGSRWLKRLADLGLSSALRDVLAACLEDDPGDRPPDAVALGEALAAAAVRPDPMTLASVEPLPPPSRVGRLGRLEGHAGGVEGLVFSPDGRRVATGGADQTLRLWDPEAGRELGRCSLEYCGVGGLAFAPGGGEVACGGSDRAVHLWDPATSWERRRLVGHRGRVLSVVWLPGGRLLSAGADRSVTEWDAGGGRALRSWIGHTDLGWLTAVFSPDGRRLLTGAGDGAVRLWDALSGELLRSFAGHAGPVLALAFTPDGRRVLSGGQDRLARVWDAETGTEAARLDGHAGWVWTLAVSPDGRRALSGSSDTTLRLWDLTRGEETLRFTAHRKTVRAVAFSPDGRRAASGGADQGVCLWGLPA